MKNWSRGKSFHSKTRTFSPKTQRGGVVRGSDREGCCGGRPHYHKGGKRLRRAGESRPSGGSGASPGLISAPKRTNFLAEASAEGKEGIAGVFCSKFRAERPTNGLNRARCRGARRRRRATDGRRSRSDRDCLSVDLRRFWLVFAGFCMRKKELSKTNTKVPVSSHYPPVKCPQIQSRIGRFRLTQSPRSHGTTCDGRRSSGGRSRRKVGPFWLNSSRSQHLEGLSLSNTVSLGFKLEETVEKFYRSPSAGRCPPRSAVGAQRRRVSEPFSARRASTRLKVGSIQTPTRSQEHRSAPLGATTTKKEPGTWRRCPGRRRRRRAGPAPARAPVTTTTKGERAAAIARAHRP